MGKVAAYALPIVTYRIPLPQRLGGPLNIDLNPGPWNIKENVLLYMMANGKLQLSTLLFKWADHLRFLHSFSQRAL